MDKVNIKNLLCKPLLLLAAMALSIPIGAQTDLPNASEPFEIFAVVWRGETEVEDGFRDYLKQRNIPFNMTVRSLNLDRGRAPAIVEEIKQTKPDLVYTWGTGTTLSILGPHDAEDPSQFVEDVPGLFVLVAYPMAAKIVKSFESTGRSVTGVSFLASLDSQFRTIIDYREFKKIAVIYDDTSRNSRINVEDLKERAVDFDIELLELPVPLGEDAKPDPEKLPELIHYAKSQGAELLYMGPDSFLARHGRVYTSQAIAAGLPTFAATQAPLKNSRAMFGLVSDYYTLGKLAAVQAERILVDNKKPQELPVTSLSRYKLWINIDVVREIQLYPPISMIAVADFKTTDPN